MTTSVAASNDNIVKVTTFPFQYAAAVAGTETQLYNIRHVIIISLLLSR